MKRMCIYTHDIQRITDKTERQCRNIYNDIKVFYKKQKHQVITIYEFCDYMGLDYNKTISFLKLDKISAKNDV
ncbi:MAG: hypothetical protein J0L86_05330 [Flavobacteriales bacterium]|nr:hypothetical protein [Flavobacteriales bacterium]